jgi:hypothetical protein
MMNQKNARFNLGYGLITLALFGLILLSVIPTMFGGISSSTMIVQPALGQPEDPFPGPGIETLTPAQRSGTAFETGRLLGQCDSEKPQCTFKYSLWS